MYNAGKAKGGGRSTPLFCSCCLMVQFRLSEASKSKIWPIEGGSSCLHQFPTLRDAFYWKWRSAFGWWYRNKLPWSGLKIDLFLSDEFTIPKTHRYGAQWSTWSTKCQQLLFQMLSNLLRQMPHFRSSFRLSTFCVICLAAHIGHHRSLTTQMSLRMPSRLAEQQSQYYYRPPHWGLSCPKKQIPFSNVRPLCFWAIRLEDIWGPSYNFDFP